MGKEFLLYQPEPTGGDSQTEKEQSHQEELEHPEPYFVKPKPLIPKKSVIGMVASSDRLTAKETELLYRRVMRQINRKRLWFVPGSAVFEPREGPPTAGPIEQRANDFIEMVETDSVSAIWCGTGGYGAIDLLDHIVTEKTIKTLRETPKILIGFSDFSFVLMAFASRGFVGFHGPNLLTHFEENIGRAIEVLLGKLPDDISSRGHAFNTIIPGEGEGILLISNLQNFMELVGTNYDPLKNIQGPVILGFEDVAVTKSHILRWFNQLYHHTDREKIRGVLLGHFRGVRQYKVDDPTWVKKLRLEEIFKLGFERYGVPVVRLDEFGHTDASRTKKDRISLTLPVGVRVRLEAKGNGTGRLKFLESPFAK